MSFNPDQNNEDIRSTNSVFDRELSSIENEEMDYDHNNKNTKQQKNELQTICQVEQQLKHLKVDVQEVYMKYQPQIKNKIYELTTKVEGFLNNKSFMSKGNGVDEFNKCLQEQQECKQQFSEQILFDLRKKLYKRLLQSNKANLNQTNQDRLEFIFDLQFNRNLKKIECICKNLLNFDFLLLSEKTISGRKECQKVHVYQKRIPEQIPTIIQEILSNEIEKNILALARKVKPFINKCCRVTRKKNVLQMIQLKKKLSSNQFQLFIDFLDKLNINQHFEKVFDKQKWSKTNKEEILQKFKMNIKNAKEKRFPAIKRKSKTIKKSK